MHDVLGPVEVLFDRGVKRTAETVIAVLMKSVMQSVNVGDPPLRTPVNQLSEKLVSFGAELQQMFSFQIPFAPFPRDRRDR